MKNVENYSFCCPSSPQAMTMRDAYLWIIHCIHILSYSYRLAYQIWAKLISSEGKNQSNFFILLSLWCQATGGPWQPYASQISNFSKTSLYRYSTNQKMWLSLDLNWIIIWICTPLLLSRDLWDLTRFPWLTHNEFCDDKWQQPCFQQISLLQVA